MGSGRLLDDSNLPDRNYCHLVYQGAIKRAMDGIPFSV
jgi:hypothetical protein